MEVWKYTIFAIALFFSATNASARILPHGGYGGISYTRFSTFSRSHCTADSWTNIVNWRGRKDLADSPYMAIAVRRSTLAEAKAAALRDCQESVRKFESAHSNYDLKNFSCIIAITFGPDQCGMIAGALDIDDSPIYSIKRRQTRRKLSGMEFANAPGTRWANVMGRHVKSLKSSTATIDSMQGE